MFIRFVVHRLNRDSGRRLGLFQALADLTDDGVLLPHEQDEHDKIYDWFLQNLRTPQSFSRSSKPHAKKVAISWFKSKTATEHIARMHAMAQILRAHGVEVDIIKTERPGYVVYEDEYQVAAEPFGETVT